MRRVVLFANSTWCIYNFRLNLMRELLRQGCSVHVIAPLDPTYDNAAFLREFKALGVSFSPVPLRPRGLNPLRELASIFSIFLVLRSLRPDVVLSFTVKCNLYAGFCRQVLGFKQIANVPGLGEVFERKSLLSQLVSCLYRVAFRGMSMAFFQNRDDLQDCLKSGLVPQNRCAVLPGSGVDLTRFEPSAPPRHRARRVFLMFGRLLPQKGYLEYLAAAEELRESLGEKAECWVMGIEDKNRPESTALYQTLKDAESRGLIRLLPATVDVIPILMEVDVVVLPSRYNEGIPRSLLEAMATAKVIVTTDWRGCRETVEHKKNGFLIPVNSVPGLVQAMLKLAEMDDAEISAMGWQSRLLVEQRYDEKFVIREYLHVALGSTLEEKPLAEKLPQPERINGWLGVHSSPATAAVPDYNVSLADANLAPENVSFKASTSFQSTEEPA